VVAHPCKAIVAPSGRTSRLVSEESLGGLAGHTGGLHRRPFAAWWVLSQPLEGRRRPDRNISCGIEGVAVL